MAIEIFAAMLLPNVRTLTHQLAMSGKTWQRIFPAETQHVLSMMISIPAPISRADAT
jgi:hypothetical protein